MTDNNRPPKGTLTAKVLKNGLDMIYHDNLPKLLREQIANSPFQASSKDAYDIWEKAKNLNITKTELAFIWNAQDQKDIELAEIETGYRKK